MDDQERTATIMVVDDTPENLNLLRRMLGSKGYNVMAFPEGRLALEAAASHPPDLILLDIMMPETDGLEVARSLKAHEAPKDIPILFISALTEAEDKVKAFFAGGVDYVTKPFHLGKVHARIETHLKLRRMKLELERHNLHLEELVKEKVREISDSQMAIILAVTKLAEFRDDETGHHIERTRTFCKILAEQIRLNPSYTQSISDAYVENIFHAAPLHDIGKVGIPDSILLKPDKLTPSEFEIMKTHTMIGARTLQAARGKYPKNAFVNMGIAIAHHHHERWDGTGYPDGLAGEDIPLAARIMALADVYDALRSQRPYKEPFSHERSCEIIVEGAGRHFDPAVVDAFKEVESKFAEIRQRLTDSGE